MLQTRDYFGTTVDHLGVRAPHDELLVVAEASVETTPIEVTPGPVSCERLSDQRFVNQQIEYLAPSRHVQWGDLIDEVASWAVHSAPDDVSEHVLAVVRAVPTVLAYERGSTSIGVTLEELVDGGRGVCQDFAHLAVGMLRCVGIPARYVSGYLFALDETRLPETDPDAAGDGSDMDPGDGSETIGAVPASARMTVRAELARTCSERSALARLRGPSRYRRMPGSRPPCPDSAGTRSTRPTAGPSVSAT